MNTYLISWTTKNHHESIAKFKKTKHDLDPGIKVLHSAHVLGEPRGIVLVETADPKLLHSSLAKWASMVDCEVRQVLSDDEAIASLAHVVA